MVRLSNGHAFQYVVASGALGFDGRGYLWEWPFRWLGLLEPRIFTVFIKTLTYTPRKGNLRWSHPWTCVKPVWNGWGRYIGPVNAVGLTNPGYEWWCEHVGPKIEKRGIPLAGSILSDNPQELAEMASRLNDFPLKAVENNASCPNSAKSLLDNSDTVIQGCEAVAQASRHPQIVKLSVAHDFGYIVPRLEGMVEAISLNSVPWQLLYPDQQSPLHKLGGGGVSGKAAQERNWTAVKELVAITDIPVIVPSVWEYEDFARADKLGGRAYSFGSIHLPYCWRPTQYAFRHAREGLNMMRQQAFAKLL